MRSNFDLSALQKKGASKAMVGGIIGLVIALILVANTAPTALVGLFNTTAFTGVPTWVTTVLGTMGALAFVLILWKVAE